MLKTQRPVLLAFLMVACSTLVWAKRSPLPAGRQHREIERFANDRPVWKHNFFYRLTNAESYYYLTGSKADIRPKGQHGLWLSLRGTPPTQTPRRMRLLIKPGLGLEGSFIAFGLNSHLARMTVRFYDKRGRVFAISCVPKTSYYVYTQIAVPIRRGLSAIEFDGHGGQVPGNININDFEVVFGAVSKSRRVIIHEHGQGRCIDLVGPVDANSRKRSPSRRKLR